MKSKKQLMKTRNKLKKKAPAYISPMSVNKLTEELMSKLNRWQIKRNAPKRKDNRIDYKTETNKNIWNMLLKPDSIQLRVTKKITYKMAVLYYGLIN